MLQGRLFSYGDAQRYRLGVNHHLIPVNAARCPVHSYHRDGVMRVDGNHGSTLGYEPNSYGEWQQQPGFSEPPLSLEGAADHWNHRADDDYYSQAGKLFRLMSSEQKAQLFGNTARAIGGAPREIQIRHIGNCLKADPAYGKGVADALGIPLSELPKEAESPPRTEARM
jgi:catalase